MRPVNFTNYTADDFSHLFGGERWDFPQGKTVILEAEKACHFAKHLVDRELMKLGKQVSDTLKHSFIKKISPDLMFDPNRKHQVIIDKEGRTEAVIPGGDAFAPKIKSATDKALTDMTRAELEKKADELQIDAEAVKKASSNKLLINLIEGIEAGLKLKKKEEPAPTEKDEKKPAESEFEGIKKS